MASLAKAEEPKERKAATITTSLLRYETPFLVSTNKQSEELPLIKEANMSIQNLLPSYCYEENGQKWQQDVSQTPATRDDILNLEKELIRRLKAEGAKETGICPTREKLYTQCFDELIRQIGIQCFERGYVLKDVKDTFFEIKDKYKELCESMLGYGIRRCIQGEVKHEKLTNDIKRLEENCNKLTKVVQDLEKEAVEKEEKAAEEDAQLEKDHLAGVEERKKKIAKYKNDIKELLTSHKISA